MLKGTLMKLCKLRTHKSEISHQAGLTDDDAVKANANIEMAYKDLTALRECNLSPEVPSPNPVAYAQYWKADQGMVPSGKLQPSVIVHGMQRGARRLSAILLYSIVRLRAST